MKIEDIRPYKNNAKKHSFQQISKVADSIKRFGFVQPIVVDKNNEIVIVHCRYEASKFLKLEDIPTVSVENLSDEEVKALRVADNKLNESNWDMDIVIPELKELSEDLLRLTGFTQEDLNKIKEKVFPEQQFAEELMEEHQYVVLYFDNEIDWLNFQSIYPLEQKAMFDKNNKLKGVGLGRVIKGTDFINKVIKNGN